MTHQDPSDIDTALLLKQQVWLQALARGLVGDVHDAEDLAQGTYLKVAARAGDPLSMPRAWLARVTRNLAFSGSRAARNRATREQETAPSEDTPSVAEAVERAELRQRVNDAVLALDSPYREVVILRYLEGLSTRQVAARMGASEPAVRTRLSRGLSQLRARLDEEYGGQRKAWMVVLGPLARRGEPSVGAASSVSVSGLMIAKVVGGLVLLGALAMPVLERWMPERAADPVSLTPLAEVQGSSAPELGESPPDHITAASAHAVAGSDDASRTAVQLPPDRSWPVVEFRVEAQPSSPDFAQSKSYRWEDEQVMLGSPRFFNLEHAGPSQDALGYPALVLSISEQDRVAFRDWSVQIKGRRLSMVLDGELLCRATVKGPLDGSSLVIASGSKKFTKQRVNAILARLGFPQRAFVPYTFHAQVVATEGGTALDGIRVSRLEDPAACKLLPGGLIRLEVSRQRLESFLVEVQGYAAATVFVARGHGNPGSAQIVDLEKSASLQVRVTGESGAPLEGAWIELARDDIGVAGRPRWARLADTFSSLVKQSALTSEDGLARFEDLVPERVVLLKLYRSQEAAGTNEPALHAREIVFLPAETRRIELNLPAARVLRGLVIGPQGQPLAGVALNLFHGSYGWPSPLLLMEGWPIDAVAETDARGEFELDVMHAESTSVVAPEPLSLDGVVLAAFGVPLQENARNEFELVTIQMKPALLLGGKLVDPDGSAARGKLVFAHHAESSSLVVKGTDEQGRFLLDPLPQGTYSLDASIWQNRLLEADGFSATKLDIKLVRVVCSLRVSVAGVPDQPHESLQVSVFRSSTQHAPMRAVLTPDRMQSNEYVHDELRPGSYSVVAWTRDGRIGYLSPVELSREQRVVEVELELSPAGILQVRSESSCVHQPYEVWLGETLVAANWARTGVPETLLVPAGSLEVRWLDERGKILAIEKLTTRAGVESRAEFGG